MNNFLLIPSPPTAEFGPDGGRSWNIFFNSFRVPLPKCLLHPGTLRDNGSWFVCSLLAPVLHSLVSCGQDTGDDDKEEGLHDDVADVVTVKVQKAMVGT